MTRFEIDKDYAYLGPGCPLVEPERATVLALGSVLAKVRITHPDEGEREELVNEKFLFGPWEDQARVEAQTTWEPGKTWAEVATERHAEILVQRELADRLTELGIPRARAHYATRGGTEKERLRIDTRLFLTHAELDKLLSMIENPAS